MITNENMLSGIAVVDFYIHITPDDVYMSYLPLAHMMERLFLNAIVKFGCSAVFSCGDILKIKDDLAAIRPTLMAIVPRLITRFYGII